MIRYADVWRYIRWDGGASLLLDLALRFLVFLAWKFGLLTWIGCTVNKC